MSAAILELEPRLDLRAVSPLAVDIIGCRGADLALNAAKVEHIGALAVQVIRAAARSWAQEGHVLSFENASTELADQLMLLGFTSQTVTVWEVPQ